MNSTKYTPNYEEGGIAKDSRSKGDIESIATLLTDYRDMISTKTSEIYNLVSRFKNIDRCVKEQDTRIEKIPYNGILDTFTNELDNLKEIHSRLEVIKEGLTEIVGE